MAFSEAVKIFPFPIEVSIELLNEKCPFHS